MGFRSRIFGIFFFTQPAVLPPRSFPRSPGGSSSVHFSGVSCLVLLLRSPFPWFDSLLVLPTPPAAVDSGRRIHPRIELLSLPPKSQIPVILLPIPSARLQERERKKKGCVGLIWARYGSVNRPSLTGANQRLLAQGTRL